jgi:hypothetical protein
MPEEASQNLSLRALIVKVLNFELAGRIGILITSARYADEPFSTAFS